MSEMAENMDATGSGEQQEKRGMSRRTVLAGAAWSVPVVAVATAVPAYAGFSPEPPPVEVTAVEGACKFSNSKVYHFELVFTNTTGVYITISDVVLTPNASSGADVVFPPIPGRTFAPGESYVLVVNSQPSDTAASFDLELDYTWTAGDENGVTDPPTDSGSITDLLIGVNIADCNSQKPPSPYQNVDTPNFAQWLPNT
ncbi:hypothetical protein V5H98_16660 [Georgenia sp. M64]|uniref:hypothetical protein n=1 Tax=Georgenia sp. M64 TaxID=3120520 RepID=UPI0030DEF4C7